MFACCSVLMPANASIFYSTPKEEKAKKIVEAGNQKVIEFADALISGKHVSYKGLNPLISVPLILFYKLFTFGTKRAHKYFKVDENKCNSCGYCAEICPVKNITMEDGKPKWTNHTSRYHHLAVKVLN